MNPNVDPNDDSEKRSKDLKISLRALLTSDDDDEILVRNQEKLAGDPDLSPRTLDKELEKLVSDYQSRISNIRRKTTTEKMNIIERIENEKRIHLADLYAQEDLQLMQAKEAFETQRKKIVRKASVLQTCTYCNTGNHKYLPARCSECKVVAICNACLKKEIPANCKCSNCTEISNMICKSCQKAKLKRAGWFAYDICKLGCGYLCPDHYKMQLCQSCGYHIYCDGLVRQCLPIECTQCDVMLCRSCREEHGCLCQQGGSAYSQYEDSKWMSFNRRSSKSEYPPAALLWRRSNSSKSL